MTVGFAPWLSTIAAAALGCLVPEAPGSEAPPVVPPGRPVVLVGAGDIAACASAKRPGAKRRPSFLPGGP